LALFKKLYVQVLVAVFAGAALGYFLPMIGADLKVLGDAFIRLIRMMLAPVIFTTVVLGIAKMDNMKELGRVGLKALIYFEVLSTAALLIGLIVVNVVQPGAGINADPHTLDGRAVTQYANAAKTESIIDFLVNIIPVSITDAFAKGDILPILFFGLLLGVALAQGGEKAQPVVSFLESMLDALFRVVRIVMRVAPLGAFGAMAVTISRYGLGTLLSLSKLMLCVYLTSILFVIVVFGFVARLSGFSLWRFLSFIKDEIFTVFGTCSSESVLPQLMQKMEKAGCPRSLVGLVLPAGLTFNPDGSAIYFSIAAVFIAQATNTPLSVGEQLTILGVLLLTSKGSAGVAGAGFITLAATLATMNKVPLAGMVLLLGVDRFMAEARSVTNTIGNAVGTMAIAAWEGVLDRDKLADALGGTGTMENVSTQPTVATAIGRTAKTSRAWSTQ
jgi:aerobic C4-dicarboxylate transport protein